MKHLSIAIAVVAVQVASAQTFTAYNNPDKRIPYAQTLKNAEKFMKAHPKMYRPLEGAPPEVHWTLRGQDHKTWDITFLEGFKSIHEVVKGRKVELFEWPNGHQYLYDPSRLHGPGSEHARP
jgi:hypothetical protein